MAYIRLAIRLSLTIALVALSQVSAKADLILAEYLAENISASYAVERGQTVAQTFTSNGTGFLSSIDLQIGRQPGETPIDDLFIDIVSLDEQGLPDAGDVLASAVLTPADVPEVVFPDFYTNADFSNSGLLISEGDELAILLRSNTRTFPEWYLWANHRPSEYDGGTTFTQAPPGSNWSDQSRDSGFRVYAIPEPPAYGLVAMVLLVFGAMRAIVRIRKAGTLADQATAAS